MFVHELIFERCKNEAEQIKVVDVRIGLGYTLVELENSMCGLSYSFTKELNIKTCTLLESAGELIGKKALCLLERIFSYNLLDASLGLACANAIINSKVSDKDIDITAQITSKDKVVMVGYFSPLVKQIKDKTERFIICERDSREGTLPDYAAYFEMQDADVVIITATSIINKTIDNLLEHTQKARIVSIMGPSTPMDREIFKNRATHLCGSVVSNIKLAKDVVSQGGGTKKLKPAIKKACVVV